MGSCSGKQALWRVLREQSVKFPYDDPAFPFHSRDSEERGICTPMFTAALLTTAKRWPLPKRV